MALLTLTVSTSVTAVIAQSATPPQHFDVAVIKPGSNGPKGLRVGPDGQFTVAGLTLRELIATGYGIPVTTMRARIVGGPAWLDSSTFDIIAKASGDLTPASQLSMLQSLLADRFALQIRREQRDTDAYALALVRPDRLGTSLATSKRECGAMTGARTAPTNIPPPCVVRVQPGRIEGEGITIDMLVRNGLSRYVTDRVVVDRTNLDGLFDVRLEWTPPPVEVSTATGAASDGVSLFTALQEQLGLKLQPARVPVDVLAIERAELPQFD